MRPAALEKGVASYDVGGFGARLGNDYGAFGHRRADHCRRAVDEDSAAAHAAYAFTAAGRQIGRERLLEHA